MSQYKFLVWCSQDAVNGTSSCYSYITYSVILSSQKRRHSTLILPVILWHTMLNLSSLYNWEYSANIKRVITHPNMLCHRYGERQRSTQCADANVCKCTEIETQCCLSHPEIWHDKNRQIQGVKHSIQTHKLYCILTQRAARVSILFVLAVDVASGFRSVRLHHCIS